MLVQQADVGEFHGTAGDGADPAVALSEVSLSGAAEKVGLSAWTLAATVLVGCLHLAGIVLGLVKGGIFMVGAVFGIVMLAGLVVLAAVSASRSRR